MTARFEMQDQYAVSADQLLALLTDPEFQRDRALALGALRARCSRQESEGIVELELFETTKTPWSRGGSQDSTMILRWDSGVRESTWRRVIHGFEDRSRAEGWSRIVEEAGNSCRLLLGGEVEVRVPVLGRIIERKVVEGIERGHASEVAFFRRRLGI